MFPNSFFAYYGDGFLTVFFFLVFAAVFAWRPLARIFDWKTALAVFLIGNSADYLSTWLCVSRYSIFDEGQPFMRWLMERGWGWFSLYKLGVLGLGAYFLSRFGCRNYRIVAALLLAIGAILFIITIHNMVIFFHGFAGFS